MTISQLSNDAFWALVEGVAPELFDVTVAELRLEAFLPADEATAAALQSNVR